MYVDVDTHSDDALLWFKTEKNNNFISFFFFCLKTSFWVAETCSRGSSVNADFVNCNTKRTSECPKAPKKNSVCLQVTFVFGWMEEATPQLTPKVGAVWKFGLFVAFGEDAHNPVLNEVHFLPNSSLSDNVIARLEYFKPQLGKHGRNKVGVGIGKQRHRSYQLSTVEVDDFLLEGIEADWKQIQKQQDSGNF